MLLLTSVNDRLQVVTSSTATINVHASWVDTSTGTITPGRTNTTIVLATTTSVAGAPAASTQRNVKTLHVRNVHASLSNDITIQHTDGTVTSQLYKITLAAGEMMEYTDQGGFGGGKTAAPPAGGIPKIVKFTTSGTYTPTAGLSYAIVECIGGGAGGGGGAALASQALAGGGGGSGGYSMSILTAAAIGASQTITIGTGGVGGIGASGTAAGHGGNGGDTSFGALVIAKGGSGGRYAVSSLGHIGAGGAGGIAGTGDITASGGPGGSGALEGTSSDIHPGGEGGSSYFGGAAPANPAITFPHNGLSATGFGSGGSGACTIFSTTADGGAGSAGIVIITEHFG